MEMNGMDTLDMASEQQMGKQVKSLAFSPNFSMALGISVMP